jgi:ABC-2 type transport system permease protein
MRGSALLVGHMAGVMVLGLIQSLFYICFALVVGVRFQAGAGGAVVILVLASTIAASFGMLGAYLALRTGSGEAIQATFPFLFVFLFISSMNTPRNLIAVEWFKVAATINPVSYLIEGVRSLIITGWDETALLRAFAVAIAIGAVSVMLASRALGQRMART